MNAWKDPVILVRKSPSGRSQDSSGLAVEKMRIPLSGEIMPRPVC